MPRPDLAGAVLIKAMAARSDKRRGAERHLRDLAFLLSLVPDPFVLADELGSANRNRVRSVTALADQSQWAWALLEPAARFGAMAAYTVITGVEVLSGRVVTRHVAHVEARGLRTRRRLRRQQSILGALSERYAALPPSAGGAPASRRRPIASFAFSVRTSRREAVDSLTAILDQVDPAWRRYVRVWDGFRG